MKNEYENLTQEEVIKTIEESIRNGYLAFVSWKCEKCGENVGSVSGNKFFFEGYKHSEKLDGTECNHISFPKLFGLTIIKDEKKIAELNGMLEGAPNCIFCGKQYEGMGNNPRPLSDVGRCCNKCNNEKVVPARSTGLNETEIDFDLDNKTHRTVIKRAKELGIEPSTYAKNLILDDIKGFDKEKKDLLEFAFDENIFKKYNIQPNDRLQNYQLFKRYFEHRLNIPDENDFLNSDIKKTLRNVWFTFLPSIESAKLFCIPDETVPVLLHTDADSGMLPFPNIFLDTQIVIRKRTYYGIMVGSFYTEKESYKGVFTVFGESILRKGEEKRLLSFDFFSLEKTKTITELNRDDYYKRAIRSFIFSFCHFINEPDVETVSVPANPKNNVRRRERNLLELPEYRNVIVRGKLKRYIDRLNENIGATHKPFSYRFWVRGFYRHFRDEKRYAHLYTLPAEKLHDRGYISENNLIKKWIKPHIRGEGILIKQSWEVQQ